MCFDDVEEDEWVRFDMFDEMLERIEVYDFCLVDGVSDDVCDGDLFCMQVLEVFGELVELVLVIVSGDELGELDCLMVMLVFEFLV